MTKTIIVKPLNFRGMFCGWYCVNYDSAGEEVSCNFDENYNIDTNLYSRSQLDELVCELHRVYPGAEVQVDLSEEPKQFQFVVM
jgi:hypothetical protein